MTKFVDDLHRIDCYKMLMGKEYVTLALYYFYKLQYNHIDIFSDEIKIFERLIEDYNNSLQEKEEREKFASYILNFDSNYIQSCIIQYDREPWKYSKPVIWKDRNKGDYYIRNLTESHRFELYVACIFKHYGFDIGLYYGKDEQYAGESRAGIEIKYDKESLKTRNIYIEYKERLNVSAKYCYAAHESHLHQNDRCKRFTLCLVLTVRFRSLAPWGKLFQLFI